jgi:hypothetical protein
MMARSDCYFCGNHVSFVTCPHPWDVPFDQWPQELILQIRQRINKTPIDGS